MEKQIFKRNIEDFICENCNEPVKGNGYTNHCPHCLCSKHVDINVGDRENPCKGLMIPIDYVKKNGKEYILHKCTVCGVEKLNKIAPNDNKDILLEILSKKAYKN